MEEFDVYNDEGTVIFLPERLNRIPVVLRGLTNDEVIAVFIMGIIIGLVVGLFAYGIVSNVAIIPMGVIVGVALNLMITSTLIRRLKRNKPDTWLYRRVQWLIQYRFGFKLGNPLILRSGYWTIRRTQSFRDKLLKKLSELEK